MTKLNADCFIGEKTDVLNAYEGWSDSVAIHLSTNQQTFLGLDAKTLAKTVLQLDHSQIIIAGDNDR